MISDKKSVQQIVAHLKAYNIDQVVISPGSRNAPFTFSFNQDPFFKTFSIVDERSAAFFALGIAQQSGKAVALSCTSGTALLNYAPAIAEAYYQGIPLIVLSADRPEEWLNQGIGQTIDQKEVYKNFIQAEIHLKESDKIEQNAKLLSTAFSRLHNHLPGPIHINIPLDEPLYRFEEKSSFPAISVTDEIIQSGSPDLEEVKKSLLSAKRILVLSGLSKPNVALTSELEKFAQNSNVLVMTETSSNLHSNNFLPCTDRLIFNFDEEEINAFQPDVLITLGTNIVSKKIKQILLHNPPKYHWHIDPFGMEIDTFKCLSASIPIEMDVFIQKVNELNLLPSDYKAKFHEKDQHIKDLHDEYLATCAFSDLKVFDKILAHIPRDQMLQMGNSSVVRYIQLFNQREDLIYFANRGTSGIDGCTSTAIGAALESNRDCTFISGDVAFFYDSNALWNRYIPKNFKIILINNKGGGIFRIIQGPKRTGVMEEYFETQHSLNAAHIAKMFNIEYHAASDMTELDKGLNLLYSNDKPSILEIFTPQEENDLILKAYFKCLKQEKGEPWTGKSSRHTMI